MFFDVRWLIVFLKNGSFLYLAISSVLPYTRYYEVRIPMLSYV